MYSEVEALLDGVIMQSSHCTSWLVMLSLAPECKMLPDLLSIWLAWVEVTKQAGDFGESKSDQPLDFKQIFTQEGTICSDNI